jgi:hypothetical protein
LTQAPEIQPDRLLFGFDNEESLELYYLCPKKPSFSILKPQTLKSLC